MKNNYKQTLLRITSEDTSEDNSEDELNLFIYLLQQLHNPHNHFNYKSLYNHPFYKLLYFNTLYNIYTLKQLYNKNKHLYFTLYSDIDIIPKSSNIFNSIPTYERLINPNLSILSLNEFILIYSVLIGRKL